MVDKDRVRREHFTYRIKKISDLHEIPSSRIDKCLDDLKRGIKLYKEAGMEWERIEHWDWIDDGEDTIYVKILSGGE